MKLSYTTVSIAGKLNFDESVKLAKETGCAGLEFRTGNIFPHGIEVSLTKEARKEKRRIIEDNYLEIACLNSEFMLHNPDAAERAKIIEGAVRTAELAADLGCKRVRVFGNDIPKGVNAQDCVNYVGDTLAEIAGRAAPMNVDILLEMHGQFNYWGYTLPAVQRADRPNTGILYNCDTRDLVGGSVRETFSRVKNHVRHIHMHNIGEYPYVELFTELIHMGYDGYLSAEIDASDDPVRVLKLHNECVRVMYELAGFLAVRR